MYGGSLELDTLLNVLLISLDIIHPRGGIINYYIIIYIYRKTLGAAKPQKPVYSYLFILLTVTDISIPPSPVLLFLWHVLFIIKKKYVTETWSRRYAKAKG